MAGMRGHMLESATTMTRAEVLADFAADERERYERLPHRQMSASMSR